ncbi:hypothetical protein ACI3E1_04040 [Ligilactobacillus sp. LYQ139]|uniref:hypothetical protein n=1 Tax=Ligilactobacillus sp. LYQ139 TaxID=3378800 RepID=UPI003854285A
MASGGIKVKLGSVSSQASSTSSAVSKLNDKFRELRNTVDDVTESNGLEGKAYRSARTFIKSVINPAITGVITAGDQLRDGVKKLHSEYTMRVDDRSWSVKELNEKIRHYKSEGKKLNQALDKMTGPGDGAATNSLEIQISQNSYCLEKYERIKEHLIEFSGESSKFFSGISGIIADVNAAARQLQSKDITNPECTVMKTPNSKKLYWRKDLDKRVRDYHRNGLLTDHDKVGHWIGKLAKGASGVIGWIGKKSAHPRKFKRYSERFGHLGKWSGKYEKMAGIISGYKQERDSGRSVIGAAIREGAKQVVDDGANKVIKVAVDGVVDAGITGLASLSDVFDGPVGTAAGVAVSYEANKYIDSWVDKKLNHAIDGR